MSKDHVVIDNGDWSIKAGFAGHEAPQSVFRAVVGKPLDRSSHERFIGAEAIAHRATLKLHHPIHNGIVTSWEEAEQIWNYALHHELKIPQGESRSVLLTEAPLNPKEKRDHTAQIMFEKLNASSLCLANASVLALQASGRQTGLVFDVSGGVTRVIPIHNGRCLSQAIVSTEFGGYELTEELLKMLARRKDFAVPKPEIESIRELKETHCYVALDFKAEMEKPVQKVVHTFADHSSISLGTERFEAPEAFMNPTQFGLTLAAPFKMVHEAISKCDASIRTALYGNIVLTGGSTLLPGFAERLQKDISSSQARWDPSHSPVVVVSLQERDQLAWLGGSRLASSAAVGEWSVTKAEWEEKGSAALVNKVL